MDVRAVACGATFVRDGGGILRDSFDITPEYSTRIVVARCAVRFFRYGQMGTRRFNALKLGWLSSSWAGAAMAKRSNAISS